MGTMLLSSIAKEWGLTVEEIIEAVKFLRDNRFDSMDGWELEFSNDYRYLIKIKSFENWVRDEQFANEDFHKFEKVKFKR